MDKNTQIDILNEMDHDSFNILGSKGADYGDEDVLSNFKRVSGVVKTMNFDIKTPHGYAMFMVIMKLDRINNLLTRGATPNNESVADSFIDGINYFKLAYMCYKESTEIT